MLSSLDYICSVILAMANQTRQSMWSSNLDKGQEGTLPRGTSHTCIPSQAGNYVVKREVQPRVQDSYPAACSFQNSDTNLKWNCNSVEILLNPFDSMNLRLMHTVTLWKCCWKQLPSRLCNGGVEGSHGAVAKRNGHVGKAKPVHPRCVHCLRYSPKWVPSMSVMRREKGKGDKSGGPALQVNVQSRSRRRAVGYEALTISSSAAGEWRSLEPRPRQINGLV